MDLDTWVSCFMLYMAMLSKRAAEMVPNMVAHLHTVLHLHQRGLQQLTRLEYDIQFWMEMAASADLAWMCGDPRQYISCLPGQGRPTDPFDTSELGSPGFQGEREMASGSGRSEGATQSIGKEGKKGCVSASQHSPPMGASVYLSIGVLAVEQWRITIMCPAGPWQDPLAQVRGVTGIQRAAEEVTSWRQLSPYCCHCICQA